MEELFVFRLSIAFTLLFSVVWHCHIKEIVIHFKYFGYLHQINTGEFATSKRTKIDPFSAIIDRSGLFVHVTYSSPGRLLAVQTIRRINNIVKYTNFGNNVTRKIVFGLTDGGDDGEHSGAGAVEISKIVAMQNTISFRMGIILINS